MEESRDKEEKMNLDDPLNRFILHQTAWELGLVPLEDYTSDISRILDALDPEEARTLKRKFRKFWRKTIRNNKHLSNSIGKKYYGVNNPQPTRKHKILRKTYVFYELLRLANEKLRSLKNNFEHSDTDNL